MSIQQSVNNMLATAAVVGGIAKHGIEEQKKNELETIKTVGALSEGIAANKADIADSKLSEKLNSEAYGKTKAQLEKEEADESITDQLMEAQMKGISPEKAPYIKNGQIVDTLANAAADQGEKIGNLRDELKQREVAAKNLVEKRQVKEQNLKVLEKQLQDIQNSKIYKNAIKKLGGKL